MNLDELILDEEVEEDSNKEPIKQSDTNKHTLESDNSPFSLSLRIDSFTSEKEFNKFVKCVEYLVRRSSEYKHWHNYIVENLGVNECALTEESINETKVEIHHHPITLYTICRGVINKKLENEKTFCSFDIATEVIELHFSNKVGYISLLSNLHEKYHKGFLEIPIELINGDYKYILKNYNLDDAEKDRIYELCNVKLDDVKNIGWNRNSYPGLNK